MNRSFDAISVGAGQAGPSLAGRFSNAGKTVAVIERKLLGGTCVNVGCMPTKTMIASAEAARKASLGSVLGFTVAEIVVDMARVKKRKDKIVEASRLGLEHWLASMEGCTLFRDAASFETPGTVRVGEDVLSAPAIFLNVGGRPALPPIPGLQSVPYFTCSTILESIEEPEHLVVVGGSYVGLEYAQMFRRFGAQVTIVERSPRSLMHEDEDVATTVQQILEAEGIRFRLHAECVELQETPAGIQVDGDCHEGAPVMAGLTSCLRDSHGEVGGQPAKRCGSEVRHRG